MQGIYTYLPETNYVPREYSIAAILLLLFMVLMSLVSVLNYYYCFIFIFYFKNLSQFLHRVIPTDTISDFRNVIVSVIVYMQITYAYNVC